MKRNLTVLYGSQTGTAQDLAEHVWRDSKKYYFKGSVQALNDYDPKRLLDEEFVVFVCSTTGQGVEPDNMKSFWKFLLRKNLPKDSLNGVHFSVLGLGDSSYSKYNFVAKRLNKRLLNLGGNLLMPVGEITCFVLRFCELHTFFIQDCVMISTIWELVQYLYHGLMNSGINYYLLILFLPIYPN